MGTDLLISIIVPVYNAEQYLVRCIDSIVNQSYKNIQVILVNDGSTDSSGEICDSYAMQDSRIKVIHQENSGVSSARNKGIENATGDYVLFVDSDDYIDSDTCEILYSHLEVDTGMVVGGCIKEAENGTLISRFPKKEIDDSFGSKTFLTWLLCGGKVKGWLHNKMIKKSMLDSIRFNDKLKFIEDLEFLLCIANAKDFIVRFIPHYGYHYIQTDNGLTKETKNRVQSYEIVDNGILNQIPISDALLYRREKIIFMSAKRLLY